MTGRAKISRRFWHLLSSRERGSRTRVRKVAASGVEVMNATSAPSQLRWGQISGHFRPPISDVRDTEILSSSTVRVALRGGAARADCHFASCPVSAVRTMSGFPLRLVKEDACCIDLDLSRNSSMKLARWRAVEEF